MLLITGGIAGLLLLRLVYMLPVKPMEDNAKRSLAVLLREGPSYEMIPGISATRLDNYTDALMINTALYDGKESAWKKAVAALRYQYGDETAFESSISYLEGDDNFEAESYARYWHGYLLVLKPLLLFFSYGEIRVINLMIELALAGMLIAKMSERGLGVYIKAFLAGIFFLMPFTIPMSMQYSQIYYITALAMLFLLKQYERLKVRKMFEEFYFGVGMLTCFFDFLTYPIVVVGYTLILQSILERNDTEEDTGKRVMSLIRNAVSWGSGYAGIWVMKWILSTVILKENVLKDAILSVLYRSSTGSSDTGVSITITRGEALLENLNMVGNKVFLAAVLIYILVIICHKIAGATVRILAGKSFFIRAGMISSLPFIWILAIANHSYVHCWMTYKMLSVAAFGVAVMLAALVENDKEMK